MPWRKSYPGAASSACPIWSCFERKTHLAGRYLAQGLAALEEQAAREDEAAETPGTRWSELEPGL